MLRSPSNTSAGRAKGELISIQQLRGFAALLVVLHHAAAPTVWLWTPLAGSHFGESGVDIFFVISGVIMVIAARDETVSEFWIKRIIRLLPLYWIATLIFVALRLPHIGDPGFTPLRIVESLLLYPYHDTPGDWVISPVLTPGWTLMLEVYFYFLFGVGLAIGRPTLTAGSAIALAIVFGWLSQPTSAAGLTFTRPILCEFVAGLLIGQVYSRSMLPKSLAVALPVGFVMALLSDGTFDPRLVRGLGGIFIVAGALALEGAGRVPQLGGVRTLGDASYSLYLSHTIVLLCLRKLFAYFPFHGWVQFLKCIFTALACCILVSIMLHRMLERPITITLRRAFLPAKRAGSVIAAEGGSA